MVLDVQVTGQVCSACSQLSQTEGGHLEPWRGAHHHPSTGDHPPAKTSTINTVAFSKCEHILST